MPVIVLALAIAALFSFAIGGSHQKTLTADFPRTVSLYEGSDVRVLGVPIGKVDSVTPSGTQVVVTMHYDADVKIPADAKAVIISPSIVGDRFVQLTPAYSGGQVLATAPRSTRTTRRCPSSSTRSTRASTTSRWRWVRTARTRRVR